MPRTIPLIRAANLFPIVRWMEANQVDAAARLAAADLSYWYALSPLDPIPVLNGLAVLRDLTTGHGPDVGALIVDQGTVRELGMLGGVALGARTPAEAMQRVAFALPLHSTHEQLRVERRDGYLTITHAFSIPVAADAQHAVQILFSSMIQQLCRFTGMKPPLITRIEATAHPEHGLEGFARRFDAEIAEAKSSALTLWIKDDVAINPFRTVARDRAATTDLRSIPPLAEEMTLSGTLRSVINVMLHDGVPSIERAADAGGMSVRTLQRRLAEDGTSFTELLDLERRKVALRLLGDADADLGALTLRLGYSAPSAMSRAIRRLTGSSPSRIRGYG
ncbi:helix-turn-helix domain-containing protein [Palleronia sp. KMU-117]|uniref:helix-turn-helix domain-containing protein n=1 Tax=Palleronia sp. KMU-117 TaxID=3434108 RepID=UPI003D71D5CE